MLGKSGLQGGEERAAMELKKEVQMLPAPPFSAVGEGNTVVSGPVQNRLNGKAGALGLHLLRSDSSA